MLSNPEKRSRYDQSGHKGMRGTAGFGEGMDMDDIFSQCGDIFTWNLFCEKCGELKQNGYDCWNFCSFSN